MVLTAKCPFHPSGEQWPEEAVRESKRRVPSTLPRFDLRRRYREAGALAAPERIRLDSGALDYRAVAIGPCGRLDADAVAARDGKTRGAITNLFGSRTAHRVAATGLALDAEGWVEAATFPAPQDFASADGWVEAFFAGQPAWGPRHGAEPEAGHASLWALRLGTVPYGLWSDRLAGPSMEGCNRWVARLEGVLREAPGALRPCPARGRHPGRPCRRRHEPNRGRMAQPVPSRCASPPPGRAVRSSRRRTRAWRAGPRATGPLAVVRCPIARHVPEAKEDPRPPLDPVPRDGGIVQPSVVAPAGAGTLNLLSWRGLIARGRGIKDGRAAGVAAAVADGGRNRISGLAAADPAP